MALLVGPPILRWRTVPAPPTYALFAIPMVVGFVLTARNILRVLGVVG